MAADAKEKGVFRFDADAEIEPAREEMDSEGLENAQAEREKATTAVEREEDSTLFGVGARPEANSLNVAKGAGMPRLELKQEQSTREDQSQVKKKVDRKRQLSDSSRGSIGRKERLRNALTGRSDGSGDGADQPLELPDEEFCDFLAGYDKSDAYCRKVVKKEIEDDLADDGTQEPMGDVDEAKPKKTIRIKEEIGYPTLEEALDTPFDINATSGLQQRLRNLQCQPRLIKELQPAPLMLLAKREKRCKDCR